MDNNKSERFFKELAKVYAEKEGAELKNELMEIEAENKLPNSSGLDRKINSKMSRHRFRSYSLRVLPLVASLVFAVFFYNSYKGGRPQSAVESEQPATPPVAAEQPANAPAAPAAPSAPDMEIMDGLGYSVELVSASLPSGYKVTGVDYDNAAAIMKISNDKRNRIVLITEEYRDFSKDGFSILTINGAEAYGLVKNDYCVLKYEKGNMLYTLTSKYTFGDLIEISEKLI